MVAERGEPAAEQVAGLGPHRQGGPQRVELALPRLGDRQLGDRASRGHDPAPVAGASASAARAYWARNADTSVSDVPSR